MLPKFNINRPKISDEEIEKHKDFDQLVKNFKQQSLQKAKQDKRWWKDKKVRYSTAIAGITVICTISYFALFKNNSHLNKTNDKIITQSTDTKSKTTQDANAKTAFINSPSNKIAVPYSSYKINNSKGGEIKHNTSSKINVPKNSFVDKNGKDIIGDVTIEYREFHDKGDIIASGIPMAYDSAGKKYNLESAGMFDIKGSQNGEPVFIKADKDLQIDLASANNEDRFNQYYLDTIARNWQYINHDEVHPIASSEINKKILPQKAIESKIENLKKQIEIVIPKKIDSVKIVYTKKVETLPKAKEPNKPQKPTGRPTFQIEASTADFPELAAFENAIFEVGAENKNYTADMSEITWNDVKISQGPQKGVNYLLTLTYHKRVEKLIMYPVLNGADFEKAQKKYQQKFKVYEGLVEKRETDEKRLMAEMKAKQKTYLAEIEKDKIQYEKERALLIAKYKNEENNELANSFNQMANTVRATRIFKIANFGFYYSDCPHAMPESAFYVSPIFVLTLKDKPLFPDFVYLVEHTKNAVYNFNAPEFKNIKYNPSSTNSFVIFVKNKMYLCNKTAFKQSADINFNKFTVTELPDGANNLIDFKKALEI